MHYIETLPLKGISRVPEKYIARTASTATGRDPQRRDEKYIGHGNAYWHET